MKRDASSTMGAGTNVMRSDDERSRWAASERVQSGSMSPDEVVQTRRCQGPPIASVKPADWMFTNRVWPSGENVAPANSASLSVVGEWEDVAVLVDADQPLIVLAVRSGEREAVR